MKIKTIDNIKIKMFLTGSFVIEPSELSDKIMIPNPIKKIEYLFLLYFRFSLVVNIKNNETKINTGK